jgi:hypothetical protein
MAYIQRRPDEKILRKKLAFAQSSLYYQVVLLAGGFGDWATPR